MSLSSPILELESIILEYVYVASRSKFAYEFQPIYDNDNSNSLAKFNPACRTRGFVRVEYTSFFRVRAPMTRARLCTRVCFILPDACFRQH